MTTIRDLINDFGRAVNEIDIESETWEEEYEELLDETVEDIAELHAKIIG